MNSSGLSFHLSAAASAAAFSSSFPCSPMPDQFGYFSPLDRKALLLKHFQSFDVQVATSRFRSC